MSGVTFVGGHRLSRALYDALAGPLEEAFPRMTCAAALLGPGSDVLGYDTERSTDHDWGPRLTLLVEDPALHEAVLGVVEAHLPSEVLGVPTVVPGSQHLPDDAAATPAHGVRVTTLAAACEAIAGVDLTAPLTVGTWLTVPQQSFLELLSGPVHRDDRGDLIRLRQRIRWYDGDVWRYLMAAQWQRIAQWEAFVGRTGEVGDDLGSHLATVRIVEDVVRVAFLQACTYAPYGKWLGTAFRALPDAAALAPLLDEARYARTWEDREEPLLRAVRLVAERHNDLGLTTPLAVEPRPFFDRPYRVLYAERFARSLSDAVGDPALRRLPAFLGGVDAFLASTDALKDRRLRADLRRWLDSGGR